jgi:hypothetical protein
MNTPVTKIKIVSMIIPAWMLLVKHQLPTQKQITTTLMIIIIIIIAYKINKM